MEKHKREPARVIRARILEVKQMLDAGDAQHDSNGKVVVATAACGTCRMKWNDALITGWTPAPSGRCPFEYVHGDIAELRRRGLKIIY